MSAIAEAKENATGRWATLQREHAWLAHVVRAWGRFQSNNASQYAAAITYFSFLALFPLILLGVSVVGFIFQSEPHLQTELFDNITKNVPGDFGKQLKTSINSAIKARTGVGIVGLAGVLLTGLGWIGNLRLAINAVWGVTPEKRNFIMSKVANLFVLAGLGLGIVVSLGLSTAGVAVTDQLVHWLGLGHIAGITILFKVLAVVLGLAGDMVIFGWLLIRLPRGEPTRAVALRGSLLAAVGFEILKFVGTYTISKSTHNATLGPFAGILAILIWIQLVSRFMLYSAAWMATGGPVPESAAIAEVLTFEVADDEPEDVAVPPAGVAAALLGVGALAGAGAVTWARHKRAAGD